jgi:CheY-like chemotaxis protein
MGNSHINDKADNLPVVLVIEDDESLRFLVRIFLEEICQVDEAATGECAVEKAVNRKYDAVLADINLGVGIDGIEAMRRIRDINGYAAIPIIAMTAYAMVEDRPYFLSLGFDDYLSKPFSEDELKDKIIKSIKQK